MLVAGGLAAPVDLQAPPGEPRRLFVVEQGGRIRVVRDGAVVATPFLDISQPHQLRAASSGLLGLAFHPQYAAERPLLRELHRPQRRHAHRGVPRSLEPRTSPMPAASGQVLFVRQPFANHNGGGLAFGPDGLLYIGLGDGGSGGDPQGNGQSLSTAARQDAAHRRRTRRTRTASPPTTRSRRATGAREVWSYGLRNPWRFTFDRATGDLYIGDVGQGEREEVDVGLASRRGGEN